jgi:hypothetical protein
LAVTNQDSNDVSVLLNDGNWPGGPVARGAGRGKSRDWPEPARLSVAVAAQLSFVLPISTSFEPAGTTVADAARLPLPTENLDSLVAARGGSKADSRSVSLRVAGAVWPGLTAQVDWVPHWWLDDLFAQSERSWIWEGLCSGPAILT